jgi:uncharacterized protein
MNTPLTVDRVTLRRFLLECQSLTRPSRPARSEDVLNLVRRLECVQIDPVAAVERNQHLVLAARMPGYRPQTLVDLLAGGRVFEYWANAACVIPMEDFPVLEGVRRRYAAAVQQEIEQLAPVCQAVLDRLAADGPLPARAFESADRVHGYWDNKAAKTKATSHALNLLLDAARVMVTRREGSERCFDLPERAVPKELREQAGAMETAEADELLFEKYMRAFRVFDPGDFRFGWRRMPAPDRKARLERRIKAGQVVPLQVDGVRRAHYILAADVDRLREQREAPPEGQVRFLPPLDSLLWRRERVSDLFEFDYVWEVYIPEPKRKYGYYAMPILAGDRLVGRLDPRLDRVKGRLIVRLLQLEPGVKLTARLRAGLGNALREFARFHGVGAVTVERTDPAGILD